MIKKLETAEELAGLLAVKDDVEKFFPCSHGEWVQWLVGQADNSGLAVWASLDEQNKIDSYIVVVNNVRPPISRHLAILYVWSGLGADKNAAVLEEIKDWGKSMGAVSIRAIVPEPRAYAKYGFKTEKAVIELKL